MEWTFYFFFVVAKGSLRFAFCFSLFELFYRLSHRFPFIIKILTRSIVELTLKNILTTMSNNESTLNFL